MDCEVTKYKQNVKPKEALETFKRMRAAGDEIDVASLMREILALCSWVRRSGLVGFGVLRREFYQEAKCCCWDGDDLYVCEVWAY